jgi:hypothetical protein
MTTPTAMRHGMLEMHTNTMDDTASNYIAKMQ